MSYNYFLWVEIVSHGRRWMLIWFSKWMKPTRFRKPRRLQDSKGLSYGLYNHCIMLGEENLQCTAYKSPKIHLPGTLMQVCVGIGDGLKIWWFGLKNLCCVSNPQNLFIMVDLDKIWDKYISVSTQTIFILEILLA